MVKRIRSAELPTSYRNSHIPYGSSIYLALSPLRYSRKSVRDVQPAVESHVPWKLNPPVCSGDSSDYLSEGKLSYLMNTLASVTFSSVLRDIPVANPSISAQQTRDMDCTNDKIDLHRKAYQFLRSAPKTKVDLNILYRARSLAEAWTALVPSVSGLHHESLLVTPIRS